MPTHLYVYLERILVSVAQTPHVFQVGSGDGQAEVDVWWLHELLQMVIVMIMITAIVVDTGLECHRS